MQKHRIEVVKEKTVGGVTSRTQVDIETPDDLRNVLFLISNFLRETPDEEPITGNDETVKCVEKMESSSEALEAAASILEDIDMERYRHIHNGDKDLINCIEALSDKMRQIAETS